MNTETAPKPTCSHCTDLQPLHRPAATAPTCSHCTNPQGTITQYRMPEPMSICGACVAERVELLALVILEQ